jgi:hypothetical protein
MVRTQRNNGNSPKEVKHILLTCDTEVGELGLDKEGAFEIFVEGKVEGQEVGYKLINKIASQYKVKVQHFVDVYPYKIFLKLLISSMTIAGSSSTLYARQVCRITSHAKPIARPTTRIDTAGPIS